MPNTNGVSPDDILNSYRPMISFLAAAFGPNCEVVLHDIREQDKSVIAIENGSISNRIIGSPMTDLALGALHKIDKGLPYLCTVSYTHLTPL